MLRRKPTGEFVGVARKLGLEPTSPPHSAKRSNKTRSFKKTVAIAGVATFVATTTWSFIYDAETKKVFEARREISHTTLDGHDLQLVSATVVFLTATGAGSWPKPADWNDAANTVECIGSGGWAAVGTSISNSGGGGAYAKKYNVAIAGASASYNVPAAHGGDTWFGSTGTVLAKGGSNPAGGTAAASVGDVKYSGGNGAGVYYSWPNTTGGGGGAAGGPNGAGGSGTAGTASAAGNGGSAAGGHGGVGGTGSKTSNAQHGGAGTHFDGSHGAGGGGGGGYDNGFGTPDYTGGNGGLYGGGAGSGGPDPVTGQHSHGAQGIIVITYTPLILAVTRSRSFILG